MLIDLNVSELGWVAGDALLFPRLPDLYNVFVVRKELQKLALEGREFDVISHQ